MDMRNCLKLLAAMTLLCSSASAVSRDHESCLGGQFETDPGQIKRSFGKPDASRPKAMQLPRLSEQPEEITRIRSGIVLSYWSTDWSPHFQQWKAYDAERHLFIRVLQVNADSNPGPRTCDGYQLKSRTSEGEMDCLSIFAASRDDARRFACRANEVPSETARRVAEANRQREEWQRRSEEERRMREEEYERIRNEYEKIKLEYEKKIGAEPTSMPEVLVLAPHIVQNFPSQVFREGPMGEWDLLKDGESQTIDGSYTVASWLETVKGLDGPW